MRVITVTGPTTAYESEYTPGKMFPSFDTRLNERLAELDAQGAVYTVSFLAPDRGWHVAHIQIDTDATAAHLSIQEFATKLGVSRTWVSERIRLNELDVVRAGRRKLIPLREYHRLSSPSPN